MARRRPWLSQELGTASGAPVWVAETPPTLMVYQQEITTREQRQDSNPGTSVGVWMFQAVS